MPHAALRTDRCRNCGQDLADLPEAHFCPHCGQETVLHPPTLWEFVHEFITHYVALEGALWRTLAALLLRPGKLTREYFHGRRKHYVLPLRIYLTASFVFFLAAKLVGSEHSAQVITGPETPTAIAASQAASGVPAPTAASDAAAEAQAALAEAAEEMEAAGSGTSGRAERDRYLACAQPGARCSWLDRSVGTFLSKSRKADDAGIDWEPRLIAAAPYAIFLMLPLFAALLQLTYWGRRMPYGEHFVFSLHLHSFWFIDLLLVKLLPDAIAWLPLLVIPAYGCWALRNVYGGRWGPTLARASLLSLVYSLLLGLGAAALVVWVILAS